MAKTWRRLPAKTRPRLVDEQAYGIYIDEEGIKDLVVKSFLATQI
jgi:hypothetical protein